MLMELRAQRQQAEAELKLARVTYSRQQRLAQTQAFHSRISITPRRRWL